jgi:ferredoxin
MRVIVQTHKCIASGSCVMTCPQVFGQRDEDGVVHILNEHPPLDLLTRVKHAVDLCPALVFRIEDEDESTNLTIVEDNRDI